MTLCLTLKDNSSSLENGVPWGVVLVYVDHTYEWFFFFTPVDEMWFSFRNTQVLSPNGFKMGRFYCDRGLLNFGLIVYVSFNSWLSLLCVVQL